MIDVRVSPVVALGLLCELRGEQYANRGGVEFYPPVLAAGRLHRPEHQALVFPRAVRTRGQFVIGQIHLHELLPDDDHPGAQVDVIPPEGRSLATP